MKIHVTAAIFQQDDKYLICQRAHDDSLPLLWEFPGGKLEPGETLTECIIRECKEELGVEIAVVDEFGKTSYAHAGNELVFTFFRTEIVGGEISVNVHAQIKWVSVAELQDYSFCPADVEIVDKLISLKRIEEPMVREGFVATANGKIWFSVYGEELQKTPLLVLHGGPGFLSMSEGMEALWADRPVYFYDQLGCGNSDRATNAAFYSVENYVAELAEVRAALKLEEVILMGFSWGCALACAYLLAERPTGIKGVVLCAPYLSSPVWDDDQRQNIARMQPDVRSAIEQGEAAANYGEAYQAAVMAYYERHLCLLSPWPDYLEEASGRMNEEVYNAMWGPSEFTITGKLKDFDLREQLPKITEPVLLTCGDRDEAGVKTVKDFQLAFPNARMAVIPHAAHLHQIERPAIFAAVVKEFLHELD